MKSGELDQRIVIQNYITSRGASGEEIKAWSDWESVWAQVKTSSGTESFVNPQRIAEATHKIKIRYLHGLVSEMRVVWREKQLEILFVDESQRRRGEMNLLCKEVVTS